MKKPNMYQRIILVIGGLAIVLLMLQPPRITAVSGLDDDENLVWVHEGFGWVWDSDYWLDNYHPSIINEGFLIIELAAALVVIGLLFVAFADN